MSSIPRSIAAAFAAAALLATAGTAAAGPAPPTTAAVLSTPSAGDLPAGCSNHWKTPDIRVRHANRDTYLHTMSNRNADGSGCSPNGPLIGTVTNNSEFHLYFSDPYSASWCYGYYPRLAHSGYVLCDSLGA